jgi:hypothetical protein
MTMTITEACKANPGHQQDASERLQPGAHVGRLLGHDDDVIVGIVDGERRAEAVDDLAAQWRQQMQVDPVLFRQQPILFPLRDLEVVHPPDEGGEQQRLPASQQHGPAGDDLVHLPRLLHRASVL